MDEIRFIDFFSGIGAVRHGLEKAGGYKCVWSNDNDRYANQVYTRHFGEENHRTDDIRGIDADSIPDHDLLCAGFPCQAFSHAGKRLGFKDPRGTLFFEIARTARIKRPRLLLLENVRGLINHDEGKTFQTILWELGRIGYWCEWQVLDTKWFGRPQSRKRVFIIGHLGEKPRQTIFPIRETGPMDYEEFKKSEEPLLNCIDASFYKGPDKHGQRTLITILADRSRNLAGKGRNIESPKDHLNTLTGVKKDNIIAIGHTHGHYGGEPRRFYPQKYLRTIVAQGGNQRNILLQIKEMRLRYPTPLECERAQGLPDGWTEGLSKTQRYRLIGNAVTTNVITFLGHRIMDSMEVDILDNKVKEDNE